MSDSNRDSPEAAGGVREGPQGSDVHPAGPSAMHAGPCHTYDSGGRWPESQKSIVGDDCHTSDSAALIPAGGAGQRTGIAICIKDIKSSEEDDKMGYLPDENLKEINLDSALPQQADPAITSTPCCSQDGTLPYSNGKEKGGGSLPVCQPPRPGEARLLSPKVRITSTSSVCTKSSKKSHSSYKSAASQIQEVAGDDCCVHCILAVLFCEFLSLCSVMVSCLTCGGCGSNAGGGGGCCGSDGGCGDEDSCPCSTDCGLVGDCCDSSDCIEICFECCSMCFPG